MRVEFGILGPLEVRSGGRMVTIGSGRQRALLAALLIRPNQVVAPDRLAEDVWDGRPPPSAAGTLQSHVSQLRKLIEPDAPPGARGTVLRSEPAGYAIAADASTLDALRFEDLARRGRRLLAEGDPAGAAPVLAEALGLWRGPALADFVNAEFARSQTVRLEELRLQAEEDRLEAEIALGRHADVLGRLEQLVTDHPMRERLRGLHMLALYRSGRQADALRAYEDARAVLAEELGVDPGAELRRIHEAVLRHEVDLVVSAAAPPSGLVSVLLTDIEGSTRLWERSPRSMSAALARHDAVIAQAATRFGAARPRDQGEGDSSCLVFSTATAAVACAAELQRAFSDEPWAPETPIKVRIGVHTGEAELRDGNYHGVTINRCARIRGAGHGGQVLVSEATAGLVAETLPAGVSLRDLGPHRLRDLTRPERIHQLVVAGIPDEFPPLESLEIRPHNLPVQLTTFVGRDHELAELRLAVAAHRLVTLHGMGGAGKTRLAVQAAGALVDDFPDGVWFVELGSLTDPALVGHTVASALRMHEEPGRTPAEILAARLGGCTSLIVLDNCEHVLDACAAFAAAILAACTGVRILATSREPLGVAGEVTLRTPPLDLPPEDTDHDVHALGRCEAVRLFIDRARTHDPSFDLTPANARPVTSICRRLDGLPLAIELAAARVRMLPVDEIAERMNDRFRLVRGHSRSAAPRQQTLRAMIDWSYDLLGPQERVLLRRLAVFAGGFTLAAAEHTCSGDDLDHMDVLDVLERLVDKSLVVPEESASGGRYHLLESVRAYALERSDADELPALRDRHLAWLCEFAEEATHHLDGSEASTWLDRLEAERDNVRAALEWARTPGHAKEGLRLASALWPFWDRRGPWTEARRHLDELLELAPGGEGGPERARALTGSGTFAFWHGDYARARTRLHEALVARRRLRDTAGVAECLSRLGLLARWTGDLDRARELYEDALDAAKEAGDRRRTGTCLQYLGHIAGARGDHATAKALLSESLAVFEEAGAGHLAASVLANLGVLAEHEGDLDQASRRFEASRRHGDVEAATWSILNLGRLAGLRGDYDEADCLLHDALARAGRMEDRWTTGHVLEELAGLALWTERDADARANLEAAAEIWTSYRNGWGSARVLERLGLVALRHGNVETARTLIDESLDLRRGLDDRLGMTWSLQRLGELERAIGRSDRAASRLGEALRVRLRIGQLVAVPEVLERLAGCAVDRGSTIGAARLMGAASALRDRMGVAVPLADRAGVERDASDARAALGAEAFAIEWEAGRADPEGAAAAASRPG